MTHRSLVVPLAAALVACSACGGTRAAPREVEPAPASGPTTGATTAPAATRPADAAPTPRTHTAADTRFMQHMIAHHAQALVMTALVGERTRHEPLVRMAERIAISQGDETRLMEGWLRRRGETVPATGPHAHHGAAGGAAGGAAPDSAAHASMPGMLTPAELARLEQARGPAFDRLFLELMIRHHEGALAMVAALLATPGAAQESEIYRFAADVDADQRAEIRRMRALLATFGN